MTQKLLVNVAGKTDVRNKVRMLLVGERQLRYEFMDRTMSDPIFIRFDNSVDPLATEGHTYTVITCSDDIKDLALALKESDVRFTIAVDTVEQLQRMLMTERLNREGRDYIKGDDYNWMASMMGAIFRLLNDTGNHVVYLSGVRHMNPEGDFGYTLPGIFGSFGEQVQEYVDYALHYDYFSESTVNEDLTVEIKNTTFLRTEPDARHPWIFDSTGLSEKEELTLDHIIEARSEWIEGLKPSETLELTIPDDDDNINLPKGMSNSDKVKKLLEKGADTNNKEKQ